MYKYYNFLLKKVPSILTSYASKNIFVSSFPNGERIVLNLSQFYDDLFKLILKTNN